ncbi:MAG: triose-phosphate isomerase [Thermodesulfobacteriota bacterium]
MKIPVIFANWKMNKTLAETRDYFRRFLKPAAKYRGRVEIFLLVPHTVLAMAADLTKGSGIKVGSQDHFWEDFGPYSGEISAAMVKDCGGEYAMVGHYERRHYFHETGDEIYKKTRAALKHQLIPLICIGESIEQHQSGQTQMAIQLQMDVIFKDFSPEEMARCLILYEPDWAVGAEQPASPEQAQEAHGIIRNQIASAFGETVSKKVRILYGGSVRWDNVAQFLVQADVDGVGVGRAGWEPDSFLKILDSVFTCISTARK